LLIPILQRSKAKEIELILFGGLGNQLFQYFAATYLAHKTNSRLRIDSTFSQLGRSGHIDWIDKITLPGNISPAAPKRSWPYLKSFMKRRVRDFLAGLISNKQLQLKLLKQYHSPMIGYDPQLQYLIPPITLVGNFQTWKYYNTLRDEGLAPDILMKRPSSWFLSMADELARQGKVLGIHVRRGDYVGNSDIGTLSVSYYEAAARDLSSRGVTWEAVWIFTDDVPLAQNEFRNFTTNKKPLVFVAPPPDSHSFESLLLMSRSSSLIIANSTYSWWAATLGNPEKVTACPAKWFIQMEDPQDLYPDNWIQIPSEWNSR
jgi:hypothetical protein